ncbi:hypothetical protein [Pusillimonas sp. T7-7]|uniref:hypothetical protein n=1 Tax=Pusillimonas sp. (strain T7-7) TaxID=1007105 RepID=UPI001872C493|nr:hypothetical protein [Pusillimonas sp. T7-7]
MQSTKIKELTARLEQAHALTNNQRIELLKDLERYAARDLYGAARLAKDHLNKEAELRLPAALQAAPLLAKHFELRMEKERRPVDLHYEQDKQLRQPEAGRQYVGPVVGTTPNCVLQMDKETGDLIVHPRSSLVCAFEGSDKDQDLAIRYPQAAIGGVGLVTRMAEGHDASLTRENALGLGAKQVDRAMEIG